jgi:hypothetical protein
VASSSFQLYVAGFFGDCSVVVGKHLEELPYLFVKLKNHNF